MIAMTEYRNEIDRTAAAWVAEMDGDNVTADRRHALEVWMAADIRHLGAFVRMQAVMLHGSRLLSPALASASGGTAFPAPVVADTSPRLSSAGRRLPRRFFPLVIAASFLLAVVCGFAWHLSCFDGTYQTAVGQHRTIMLPDGSRMYLNTGTHLAVHYTPLSRHIALVQGEALFDVAKNKMRPFVVRAGEVSVRAVGTSFSVRTYPGGELNVTVREGVVAIGPAGTGQKLSLSAGHRADRAADGTFFLGTLSADQIQRDLAWLDGHVFFRRQTLASAVLEMNRYNNIHIQIDGPSTGAKTITGSYVATDPEGFASTVAAMLDLEMKRDGNVLHLSAAKQ